MRCVGEFRTTFRTIPASVAQWIEQRFPKPQVACSIHAGGTLVREVLVLGALSDRSVFSETSTSKDEPPKADRGRTTQKPPANRSRLG